MEKISDFQPNWISLPGETIHEILKDRKLSLKNFAEQMDSSLLFIRELVNGCVRINLEVASKLEKVLGATADFWIKRDEQYRHDITRLRNNSDEQNWHRDLPIKDMVRFGWLNESRTTVEDCYKFFRIPDLQTWRIKYQESISLTSFRTSKSVKSNINSLSAWLRQGEIQSEQIDCKPWDPDLFKCHLQTFRSLTTKRKPKDFILRLKQLCSECGVAFVIVPTPSGCSASGATKFLYSDQAMLLLSFRYLSDDQFWFSFFHESGHLLLHKNTSFIEDEDENETENQFEVEANEFAESILIPDHFVSRFQTMPLEKREILRFASDIGISPGIVVGQLQHQGRVEYKYFNGFKRRYDWSEIID
jgi:HTH-type transcriptional regulator / antitoxin HigA